MVAVKLEVVRRNGMHDSRLFSCEFSGMLQWNNDYLALVPRCVRMLLIGGLLA